MDPGLMKSNFKTQQDQSMILGLGKARWGLKLLI
jgi:hypothetical protein